MSQEIIKNYNAAGQEYSQSQTWRALAPSGEVRRLRAVGPLRPLRPLRWRDECFAEVLQTDDRVVELAPSAAHLVRVTLTVTVRIGARARARVRIRFSVRVGVRARL